MKRNNTITKFLSMTMVAFIFMLISPNLVFGIGFTCLKSNEYIYFTNSGYRCCTGGTRRVCSLNYSYSGCYYDKKNQEYKYGEENGNDMNAKELFPVSYLSLKECYDSNEAKTSNSNNGTETDGSMYCGSDYLQSGCKSEAVGTLQRNLNTVANCNLSVDNSFGPSTETCVKKFQSSNGLAADGIVDSDTLNKINSLLTDISKENDTKAENSTSDSGETGIETVVKYYTVTFNTNGGYFADGETDKKVVKFEGEVVNAPTTIPGKDGYKFLGWYNGSEKYEFGTAISSDITLTAKWETVDTTKYCLDGDVYDYENDKCITAYQFENGDQSKFLKLSNGKLQIFYTSFNYTRSCSNDNKYAVTYVDASGSNNTIDCPSGYVRETWRAEETCFSNTNCPLEGENTCHRIYRAACYTTYFPGDNAALDDAEDEIESSPKTGFNIVAIIIGALVFLGVSIYIYLKNRKSIKE